MIESNGTLTSSGSSVFYACPASDTEWNIYTRPVIGQKKCVEVTITASGCGAEASGSAIQSITTVTVYDCCLTSSTTPAIIFLSTSSPPGVIETSVPVQTTSAIAPAASTSEVVTSLSESAVIVSTSPTTPEVSSIETVSTLILVSTPATAVERSSASSVLHSSAPTLTPSYHSHSIISPSSVLEKSTASVTVSPGTSVESETSVPPGTTIVTSIAPTTKLYPTSAHYGNTTVISSSYISSSIASSATYGSTTVRSSSYISSPVASSVASSVSSASTCAATTLTGSDTSGNYQYPHLIIPISSTSPDTAYGTQYFATISSNTSTIFNFDIPSSYSGSTCNLIFLLPLHSELETSSYTSSGSGRIEFEQLSSAASSATTYDNAPSVESVLGDFTITEGSSTLIESFACPAGKTLTYELKALQDTYLYYFQDWNPSPIGLFITHC